MAGAKEKKDNAIVAYFRSTRVELRKVRWPTLDQGWSMTQIVLAVTFAMAVFLGALDFFFGWLLGKVINGSAIYMVIGIVVTVALIAAVYFAGQNDEV